MLLDEAEEHVKPFSRSDVYYNRDVEKLAVHFDSDHHNSGRRASAQALNLYRKSVSGMGSNDNDFGRRLSMLSSSSMPAKIGTMEDGAKSIATRKWLPGRSLLRNPKFHLFMLHNFLAYAPSTMTFTFLPSQMMSRGLTQNMASRVVSSMGLAGLVGRLLCGFIMDHPKIGVTKAYIVSQIILALTNLCLQFCTTEE